MTRRRRSSRRWAKRAVLEVAGALAALFGGHGRGLLHLAGVVAVVAGIMFGLSALKERVYALPEYDMPVTVRLVDAPSWLNQEQLDEMLWGLEPMRFLDERATRGVAAHLEGSGWIERVVRAERCRGGEIKAHCTFRQPLAVVQQGGQFMLVNERGVRLPGVYSDPGEFVIVQGVGEPAPPVGEVWEGADLEAGLRLVKLLVGEPFCGQVGAVSVHNHGGRESAKEAHLALLTRPGGPRGVWGRVLWGSGPGEEIEEPTASEKIRLLRANYQQCGRIDAGAAWIDVSISPGEYRKPADGQSA
ncbi:MAG: hypothetical protein JSU68_02345 [Phycisphaerales bacterium]|nr:MAG: hypothetical protein JSU68_02345 [Phycisphaerales bacterium]